MANSPEHTFLTELDKATATLCVSLVKDKLEANRRIQIAADILMLQEDRKAAVAEIYERLKSNRNRSAA